MAALSAPRLRRMHDVLAAHVDAGEQSYDLDHNAQAYGSEHDAAQDYQAYGEANTYENDVNFEQGHHVEYDNPNGAHYEEQDYTSYDHNAAETDHVFAAEGSEQSHESEYDELDALRERLDASFASGTEYHGGGEAELGVASK